MELFKVCCGKHRKDFIEEVVFALGCHSVTEQCHSREQNTCGPGVDTGGLSFQKEGTDDHGSEGMFLGEALVSSQCR